MNNNCAYCNKPLDYGPHDVEMLCAYPLPLVTLEIRDYKSHYEKLFRRDISKTLNVWPLNENVASIRMTFCDLYCLLNYLRNKENKFQEYMRDKYQEPLEKNKESEDDNE